MEECSTYLQWLVYSRRYDEAFNEAIKLCRHHRSLKFYAGLAKLAAGEYGKGAQILKQTERKKWAFVAEFAELGLARNDQSLIARAAWLALALDDYLSKEISNNLIKRLSHQLQEGNDERYLSALRLMLQGKQLDRSTAIFKELSRLKEFKQFGFRHAEYAARCTPKNLPVKQAASIFYRRRLPCSLASYKELCEFYSKHPYNFEVIRHLVMYQIYLRWIGYLDFSSCAYPSKPFNSNGQIVSL